ncbi:acyltransferase [Paenibacillus glucanolyticus]|uniref:acyltransferase family protein n=1 Tax=Paenibacillus glucanolyticus TaxID=59843 RepID=UPI0030D4C81E
MKNNYITGIDGLRAIAALIVLLFHFQSLSGYQPPIFPWFFETGWIGVDIFFTISGFLLFLQFAKAHNEKKKVDYRKYFKRRFLRILPAYYLNLFVLLTLFHISFLVKVENLDDLFQHLFFLQGFFIDSAKINGVLWTLCLEIQFYILLPFIYRFFVGNKWIFSLIIMIIVATVYKVYMINLTDGIEDHTVRQFYLRQLPSVIHQFGIGMAAASIFVNRQYQGSSNNRFSMWSGYLGILLILFMMWFVSDIGGTAYWKGHNLLGYLPLLTLSGFVSLGAVLVIWSLCNSENLLSKFFSTRIMVFLGATSYGIYLWHLPIGNALLRNIKYTAETKFVLLIMIGTALSIAWAALSFYFVEKSFLKKKD